MISPQRAPVRPRVISPETNEIVLLEDVIGSYAEQGRGGAVELVGGPRAGKTTALAHLASLAFADRLELVDDAGPGVVQVRTTSRLIVYTTRRTLKLGHLRYDLAPWCDDDLIEYLLSTHPERCRSVMARFRAAGNKDLFDGAPELYCIIGEQLAASEAVRDLRTSLRRGIAQRVGDEQTLDDARFYAAASLLKEQKLALGRAQLMMQRGVSRELFDLLGHRWVQVLLTADRIVAVLEKNPEFPFPGHELPRALVAETAQLIVSDPATIVRLHELVDNGNPEYLPMAASVLHEADPLWRPNRDRCLHLPGAYFSNACWEGIDLRGVSLARADLARSNLRGANLEGAGLAKASLRGSNLEGARLADVRAQGADFSDAVLSRACLTGGQFFQARFTRSVLNHASASEADFGGADLRNAAFCAADLPHCTFRGASLEGLDLRDANLRGADFSDQILRKAILGGADLSGSNLSRCDLEFVDLPGARFADTDLADSWLTGSVMTGADFRGAKLHRAGLADIEWEQVDLRGADLRGCSFHLGSSRSGLVGSPYPCHGSRTGFYTNEYDEHCYRAPEEIRKANLCCADLRGALIEGVDFYLVDLRGAKYDPEQASQFRQCDAILGGRTA